MQKVILNTNLKSFNGSITKFIMVLMKKDTDLIYLIKLIIKLKNSTKLIKM